MGRIGRLSDGGVEGHKGSCTPCSLCTTWYLLKHVVICGGIQRPSLEKDDWSSGLVREPRSLGTSSGFGVEYSTPQFIIVRAGELNILSTMQRVLSATRT